MPERITHPDILATMRDGAPVHDDVDPWDADPNEHEEDDDR